MDSKKKAASADYTRTIRIPKALKHPLKQRAKAEKRSVNNLIAVVLERYIQNELQAS